MALTVASTSNFLKGGSLRRSAPTRAQARRVPNRLAVSVRAKYGSDSEYFDLDVRTASVLERLCEDTPEQVTQADLEDTTGSWELYGTDDNRRYPSLQNEFFERASAPLTRRESALAFIFTGGLASILLWGAKGSRDVKLPITVGPLKGGEKGPRGRL